MNWKSIRLCCLHAAVAWLALTAPRPLAAADPFVEEAAALGLDFVHFNGMSGELYFSEMMGSGVAFLDFDGDGDQDLYLVQGTMLGGKRVDEALFPPVGDKPLSDRLFRNDVERRPDGSRRGRFVDVTERANLDSIGYGMGVTVGDFDRDGAADLYVTNAGSDRLYRNNGDGTFRDVTEATGLGDRGWGVAAVFVDYDLDGWLDLFVSRYVDYRTVVHKQCVSPTGLIDYCSPLAYELTSDRLYRNLAGEGFEEVSVRSGIAAAAGSALGVVVCDVNDDGWPDLYVANDQMPNRLWVNQTDGTFVDDAVLSGTAVNEEGLPEASMGVVMGDFDGDGREDLFISHLARETNTFYRSLGNGIYRDDTRNSGLGMASFPYTGFGVALFDFDLDGELDLFVGNGAVKRIEPLARAGDPYPLEERNQLFRNLGGGRFEEATTVAGEALELVEVTRGVAAGDYDNDGDPDLVMSNNSGPVRLLDNRQTGGRWLGVTPVGPRHMTAHATARAAAGGAAPATALAGVRVGVRTAAEGAVTRWRRSGGGGSYASSGDARVLVGVGDDSGPLRLEVRWPGGAASRFAAVPVGGYLTLYGAGVAAR